MDQRSVLSPRKCLIFDADDTLWENNIYFEAAIEEFLVLISEVNSPDSLRTIKHSAVLDLLNQIERESIPRFGYGSRYFVNSLRETFRRIYTATDGVEHLRAIDAIGERLINHPIRIMPEVASTLEGLSGEYRLILFTKGDFEEQSRKVEWSGLGGHFESVEIVAEKDAAAYRELVLRRVLDPDCTIMIGNSPRSDILPALEAGLWAVFVPHPHTWELEHEEMQPHPKLLQAPSLRELPSLLRRIFPPAAAGPRQW